MGLLLTVTGVLRYPGGYNFLLELLGGSIWMLDMPVLMVAELAALANRPIIIEANQVELGMLLISRLVAVGDKVIPDQLWDDG